LRLQRAEEAFRLQREEAEAARRGREEEERAQQQLRDAEEAEKQSLAAAAQAREAERLQAAVLEEQAQRISQQEAKEKSAAGPLTAAGSGTERSVLPEPSTAAYITTSLPSSLLSAAPEPEASRRLFINLSACPLIDHKSFRFQPNLPQLLSDYACSRKI
jgi:translation initiation factor IF-2